MQKNRKVFSSIRQKISNFAEDNNQLKTERKYKQWNYKVK